LGATVDFADFLAVEEEEKCTFWQNNKKSSACRGEGGLSGLQLRVRVAPAALLAIVEILS
jgi:hypothetical protein